MKSNHNLQCPCEETIGNVFWDEHKVLHLFHVDIASIKVLDQVFLALSRLDFRVSRADITPERLYRYMYVLQYRGSGALE